MRRKPRVKRGELVIKPDRGRVLLRPFYPSTRESAQRIVDSIRAMRERDVSLTYRRALHVP